MNNIQELRKIIADAPDGANEIDDTGGYWIYKGDGDYLLWDGREWIENWSPFHTRSLADMRTIIEQAEENEKLRAKVAELEQIITVQDGELDDFRGIENAGQLNVKQQLAIRDLEQQAKGLMWVVNCEDLHFCDEDFAVIESKADELREQAKQLKEQR